jgi:phage major head subunit gpT-like protein
MLINKNTLSELFRNIKTTFQKTFDSTESEWQKIAMKVTSSGSETKYTWLDRFPRMRKWVGDKVVKALRAHSYTVVNDDWEATVDVDRNDLEDDQLGGISVQAQSAGESAKMLPEEIVDDLVNGMFTNKCYDGQFFIDTDHPVIDESGAEQSVSNKGTVALSIATQALAKASYGVARTAMRKFTDDEGRPLKVRPNILLVGPALEDTARSLMTADRLEDGKPNPYKGTAEVVVWDGWTSDTAWALLDARKITKPFIYQERKAPVLVSQVDMNADDVFTRRKYKFGAEARAAGGYGFWQLAWASTGTG